MNAPFERPLLATEHTAFDVGAERVAFALAKRRGVPLAAVVPLASNPEYEGSAPDAAMRAEREVASRVAQLRAQAADQRVALEVEVRRDAELWRAIVDEAAARGSDLVVVRRRGERGFMARLMLGEMARLVAMHAPCSVLLVPRAGDLWSRRAVAGVDRSSSARDVATAATAIAQSDGTALTFVAVAPHDAPDERASAKAAIDAAMSVASAAGVAADARIATGRPHEAIAKAAAETDADLVVVGRRGDTTPVKRMFLGGTARGVIGLASGAVLVVQPATA